MCKSKTIFNRYFLFIAVLPFLILIALNYKTYKVIRRRAAMNPPKVVNAHFQSVKDQAAQQSKILFAVCFVFGFCHMPRLVLGIHELVVLDEYNSSRENFYCNEVPLSVLIAGSVSQLCLTLNSTLNFFIYIFTCSDFKKILLEKLVICCAPFIRANNSNNRLETAGIQFNVNPANDDNATVRIHIKDDEVQGSSFQPSPV